ncbi:MAG: ROK family protein [Clostridia bacterium]|nr:ROK family protein [Clostridia bacterium]
MYQIILDVGGTGIKGVLCRDGNIACDVREYPSRAHEPAEVLIAHFCGICEDLLSASGDSLAQCTRIAAAFPGPFDYEKGIPLIKGLAKYEHLYGICLPTAMQSHWQSRRITSFDGAQWAFLNDVSAFALGAARKYCTTGRTMCVCIGTGAGSAFLLGQALCTDTAQGVPEDGCIYPLPFEGTIMDEVLSARGITKIAEKYCKMPYTPLQLKEQACAGNRDAQAAWQYFGTLLKKGLVPVASAFRADTIIMGGKISRSSALFIT